MLVVAVRLHLEWHALTIYLHTEYLRAQTERGRELEPAISRSSSLDLEFYCVRSLVILEVHCGFTDTNIVNRKRHPVGRHVWRQCDLVLLRVRFQSKHAPQDRTDNHGRRPDLVRRTSRE